MASKTCTHIKVTGIRCGSPSLNGEQFCYFHQHAHRGVRKPPQSRLHPIAILEDEESIQTSLMEVINALMRNTIDLKRAELILRALHIAVKNARRAKFSNQQDAVREIPEYSVPETNHAQSASARVGTDAFVRPATLSEAQESESISVAGEEDELPAVAASTPKPVHPDPGFWERWERGGQVLKQQAAERKAAEAIAQAPPIAAHDFKKSAQPTSAERSEGAKVPEGRPKVAQRFSAGNAAHTKQPRAVGTPEPPPQVQTPPRKPSASVPQAPKERKNTAHGASRG